MLKPIKRPKLLAAIVVVYVVGTIIARRRGYSGLGGSTMVRCRQGHLYTPIWVPGASPKPLRLGWWRLQWCPVGRHWSLVAPVKNSDLTEEDRRLAEQYRDVHLP